MGTVSGSRDELADSLSCELHSVRQEFSFAMHEDSNSMTVDSPRQPSHAPPIQQQTEPCSSLSELDRQLAKLQERHKQSVLRASLTEASDLPPLTDTGLPDTQRPSAPQQSEAPTACVDPEQFKDQDCNAQHQRTAPAVPAPGQVPQHTRASSCAPHAEGPLPTASPNHFTSTPHYAAPPAQATDYNAASSPESAAAPTLPNQRLAPLPASGPVATQPLSAPAPVPVLDTRPLGSNLGPPFRLSKEGAGTLQQILSVSSLLSRSHVPLSAETPPGPVSSSPLRHPPTFLGSASTSNPNSATMVSDQATVRLQLQELSEQLQSLQSAVHGLSQDKECLIAERTAIIMSVQALCVLITSDQTSLALEDEVACAAAEARALAMSQQLPPNSSVGQLLRESELMPSLKALRQQAVVLRGQWQEQTANLRHQIEQLTAQLEGVVQEVSRSVAASRVLQEQVDNLHEQRQRQLQETQQQLSELKQRHEDEKAELKDQGQRAMAAQLESLRQQLAAEQNRVAALEQAALDQARKLEAARQEGHAAAQSDADRRVREVEEAAQKVHSELERELRAARLMAEAAVGRAAEEEEQHRATSKLTLQAARSHDQLTQEVQRLRDENLNLRVIVREAEQQLGDLKTDLTNVRLKQQMLKVLPQPDKWSDLTGQDVHASDTSSPARTRGVLAAGHRLHVVRPSSAGRVSGQGRRKAFH